MAKLLGIDMIGTTHVYAGTIRRMTRAPLEPVRFPYLVVSEKMEGAQTADLVVVQSLDSIKDAYGKKIRKGTGLEIQVAPVRAKDSKAIARWLADAQDLYRFCKRTRCQLVLSSGATSPWEMISGRSLDALLEEVGINPASYWTELKDWLELRLARRISL